MKDLVINISNILNREGIKLDVRTKDIDFAVLVENWDEYNKMIDILKKEMGMTEEITIAYRLIYGGIPVDILPFGQIAEPGATVRWPGKFRARMKVQGFQEAFNNAADLIIESAIVRVIIPEMLVALKLSSWSLASSRAKDAMDIRLILENVKNLCPDIEDDFHNKENENLLEKYCNNETGLWISSFGSRIQTLLGINKKCPTIFSS